jgi:hypothetical protein
MSESGDRGANPGYAWGQLARALQTSLSNPDPETRAGAEKKSDSWLRVLQGMFQGLLRVGSRTPVEGAPAWATPEVLHGGFASGRLLAGGEWAPHELALLQRLEIESSQPDRSLLNSYFVSERGFQELRECLSSGCYRISVPEEGALLVVAWLSEHGPEGSARALLEELLPYFRQLRFYPIPAQRPEPPSDRLSLLTVGELRKHLQRVRPRPQFLKMRSAICQSLPYLDRVVGMFQETVEEGWPCQRFPSDWSARASALLAEAPSGGRRSLRRMVNYLATCVKSPQLLSGLDVSRIGAILRGIEAKRGLSGSVRLEELRQEQLRQVMRPTRSELAHELAVRMESLDAESGLEDAAGLRVPASLESQIQRVRLGTLQELMDWKVVASAEVMARLVPALTARIQASEFAQPELSRLYLALYRAFRRRRSLLLLNLESQVKLFELPWVQALQAFRQGGEATQTAARECLKEVAGLSLSHWPEVILPNRLLHELRALAAQAGLDLPLVDELAADIFMNQFSSKFLSAAQLAGRILRGSLYERYYRIEYSQIMDMVAPPPQNNRPTAVPEFARLCRLRAGLAPAPRNSWGEVSENGRVIEQEQILTTHNLAALYVLVEPGLDLEVLARRCFAFVVKKQQQKANNWHGRLIVRKKSAYAWRQMLFFAALLPPVALGAFLNWATEHLGQQDEVFRQEFADKLLALLRAADGSLTESDQPFLGWVTHTATRMPA